MISSSASAVSTNCPQPSISSSESQSPNEDICLLDAIVRLDSRLRRDATDWELEAVELFDPATVTSSPTAAYQGIAGVREKDSSEDEAAEGVRLRKLPLRLYIEVLRLTIRGMVDDSTFTGFEMKDSFDGL